jgi:lipopolysaccharide biosynthesis protein
MVVPQGTAFQRNTPSNLIFPHIVKKYSGSSPSFPQEAFDSHTVDQVQKLHRKIFPKQTALSVKDICIVAGTAFWFRYTDTIETLVRSLRYIEQDFTVGYVENLGIEHVVERLIPTAVQSSGGRIEQIPPAPRVVALYFPQYHSFPENEGLHRMDHSSAKYHSRHS